MLHLDDWRGLSYTYMYFMSYKWIKQYYVCSLTRWCLKNVFREKQATPMCLNNCNTFDAELPDNSIAMHSRKFPAGILVPGMLGWLFQMTSFLLHFLFVQVEVTTAIVPTCLVSTSGFSALQKWQNLNSSSSCERKTINFGCVLRLSSLIYTLWREQKVTKQYTVSIIYMH